MEQCYPKEGFLGLKGKYNYRKVVLLLADIFIIITSGVLLNYALSLIGWIGPESSKGLLYYMIVNILTCVLSLVVCGAYTRLWRYFNIKDYIICGAAMAGGFTIGFLLLFLLGRRPRLIFWGLFFLTATVGILLFRYLFKRTFIDLTGIGYRENATRTLIVGAGQAGRMILREIQNADFDENNPSKNLLAVGFIDDDILKQGTKIDRLPVLGTSPEIERICAEYKIQTIIVAIPSCEEDEKRKILNFCSKTDCDIKVIPYLSELLFGDGNDLIAQAKEIKIEDLLGRKPIEFDRKKIRDFIRGKVCMITGGGGSIGSELERACAPDRRIRSQAGHHRRHLREQRLRYPAGACARVRKLAKSRHAYLVGARLRQDGDDLPSVPPRACFPRGGSQARSADGDRA